MKKVSLWYFCIVVALVSFNINLLNASLVKLKDGGGIKVSGMPASTSGDNVWHCGPDDTRTCYETNAKNIFIGSGSTFALSGSKIDVFFHTNSNDPNVGTGYIDAILVNDINEVNCGNLPLDTDSQTQQVSGFSAWLILAY
jgi:hypothetical protein